jgi:alpha-N-arabinofuranosidase
VGVGSTGDWSKSMLANCAEHMDYLSEHFYCQSKPDVIKHVRQIPDNVRMKAEAHREYLKDIPSLANKKIPIALDEWNYWYGPDVYGELGTQYFLKDALGIAAGLHEYYRNSDIFYMANYAQTVNVIGAIKTSKTSAAFETTGLVLRLYRRSFGTIPVKVENNAGPLDVMAAWRDGRKTLTIGVVNPTDKEMDVALSLNGAILTGTGMLQTISGNDPLACNEPGKEPVVQIEQTLLKDVGDVLRVGPLSVNIFTLDVK